MNEYYGNKWAASIDCKIAAIKAIRSLPGKVNLALVDNVVTYTATADIGLKDAKDLVEAICALVDSNAAQTIKRLTEDLEALRKDYSSLDDKFYNLRQRINEAMQDNS